MLNALPRRMKRMVLLTADILLVPIALYVAYVLRYGMAFPIERLSAHWPVLMITFVASPFIIVFFRLPWIKLSTLDFRGALRIVAAGGILAVIASLASFALAVGSARSIPGIFAVSFFILSFFSRVTAILGLQWAT